MPLRRIAGGTLLLTLAACNGGAPAANNMAADLSVPAPVRSPIPPIEAPLAQWLIGHWSYGDDCASDFGVSYGGDGRVEANGDFGRWQAEGDAVTETITERMDAGDEGEGSDTLDPPEVIRYTVQRVDGDHAVLRRGDKTQPIRRC